MLWDGGLVLNLQKRVQALEMYLPNGTLAAEDNPSFSLLQSSHPRKYLTPGSSGLPVLQAQLSHLRVNQEHLLQWLDNFTQNPGLTSFPLGLGLLRKEERSGYSFNMA
jgi:macrophage receptor with collagenous structure